MTDNNDNLILKKKCPYCNMEIDEKLTICPYCKQDIKKAMLVKCPKCGNFMKLVRVEKEGNKLFLWLSLAFFVIAIILFIVLRVDYMPKLNETNAVWHVSNTIELVLALLSVFFGGLFIYWFTTKFKSQNVRHYQCQMCGAKLAER